MACRDTPFKRPSLKGLEPTSDPGGRDRRGGGVGAVRGLVPSVPTFSLYHFTSRTRPTRTLRICPELLLGVSVGSLWVEGWSLWRGQMSPIGRRSDDLSLRLSAGETVGDRWPALGLARSYLDTFPVDGNDPWFDPPFSPLVPQVPSPRTLIAPY